MEALSQRWIAAAGVVAALAATAAAQPLMVTGTGDPKIDVPAVQAAVDQGGSVVLAGHFSFDTAPATPPGAAYARMVTVSKGVVISGAPDDQGDMPTIEGGNWPFLIDAFGSRVAIRGLRFVGPKAGAIWVYAASGLNVANCRIESVQATSEFGMEAGQANPLAGAIFVGGDPHPPNANFPGQPANFSGTLAILNNDFDVGAKTGTQTLAVTFFAVGRSPDQEVDIYVSGNTIRNVSEPAINLRIIGGRAHVERNTIATGPVGSGDAVRIVGSGSYLIAHNSIDCGWTDTAATGINLFGQSATLPEVANAIVAGNDVTMSAPEGTAFASIDTSGRAQGNMVLNNKIHGRAKAALAVVGRNNVTPANTTFVFNDLQDFQPSRASVFLDTGVSNTVIVGRLTSLEDHATGTVLVTAP